MYVGAKKMLWTCTSLNRKGRGGPTYVRLVDGGGGTMALSWGPLGDIHHMCGCEVTSSPLVTFMIGGGLGPIHHGGRKVCHTWDPARSLPPIYQMSVHHWIRAFVYLKALEASFSFSLTLGSSQH